MRAISGIRPLAGGFTGFESFFCVGILLDGRNGICLLENHAKTILSNTHEFMQSCIPRNGNRSIYVFFVFFIACVQGF